MRGIIWLVLGLSLAALLYTMLKKRVGLGWITTFGAHMALAGLGLYVVNYSGWVTQAYIPINPVTMGTVTVFGLPGVALLVGLKLTLFGTAV